MEQIVVHDGGQAMQQSGFDYSQLDEQTAKLAWQRAQEIRWKLDTISQSIVEVGKALIEVKAVLPPGCWTRWIEEEFAWSPDYAVKAMRIARAFGDIDLQGVKTSVTALQLATLPSIPSGIINQARDRLFKGSLTIDESRELVRSVDPYLADTFGSTARYWKDRRNKEVQQIASHAAEFQAGVRNLQVCLSEVYDPVHPRVKRAVDQLVNLIAVIMDTEGPIDLSVKRRPTTMKSRYTGVSWHEQKKHWHARIVLSHDGPGRGHRQHIGYFDTEEEAARAYDSKARELYGDKARLNFPDK